MGFTERQRLVLSIAWKHGHISDSKNYGTISEVTGLTRKQVSNWARNQMHKVGENEIPMKSSGDLLSIYWELPDNMKTDKDYLALLSPKLASELSAKREKTKQTRTKARFTKQQRKLLTTAWERGFLCNHKNYANLSQITGLTRKQISNWARTKINKCQGKMPAKNTAPLSTIFNELSVTLEERDPNRDEKEELREKESIIMTKHQHSDNQDVTMPLLRPPELPLLVSRPIPCARSPIKPEESNFAVLPPRILDFQENYTFSDRSFRDCGAVHLPEPHLKYDPRGLTINRAAPFTKIEPKSASFHIEAKKLDSSTRVDGG